MGSEMCIRDRGIRTIRSCVILNEVNEMKKELTTVIMVMVDGKVKPLEDLTEEEHSRMLAAMAHRLTESMSDYYAQHPDEVKELAKI